MPIDLKIVQPGSSGVLQGATWPNPDFVDGEYNLVQRIFKNLHTTPGEDMFDPDWGSGLRASVRGIPGQNLNEARRAVSSALRKCSDDISKTLVSPKPDENLKDLRLETLEYDETRAAWVCSVAVVTAANETVINITA